MAGPAATAARIALLHSINYLRLPPLDWLMQGADVFHVTNQVRRLPRRCRITATVHDLTCWLYPEFHTPANVRADANYAEHVLRRADRVLAVSENTRRDVIRILGLPEERVEAIHSGVAEPFFTVSGEEAGRVREKLGLERPYALFVGTIEPRKNLDALLAAWTKLPADIRGEFDLAIAGPTGWAPPETVAKLESAGAGVRVLGYVAEVDLPGLTRGASVFAYPSIYEGFGFPVAQAMAAGVPVLTSGTSSLEEIAGDAAVLVDPQSADEISAGLCRLLTSAWLRADLSEKGRRRAARFRWSECARRSLEFFHRAAG